MHTRWMWMALLGGCSVEGTADPPTEATEQAATQGPAEYHFAWNGRGATVLFAVPDSVPYGQLDVFESALGDGYPGHPTGRTVYLTYTLEIRDPANEALKTAVHGWGEIPVGDVELHRSSARVTTTLGTNITTRTCVYEWSTKLYCRRQSGGAWGTGTVDVSWQSDSQRYTFTAGISRDMFNSTQSYTTRGQWYSTPAGASGTFLGLVFENLPGESNAAITDTHQTTAFKDLDAEGPP